MPQVKCSYECGHQKASLQLGSVGGCLRDVEDTDTCHSVSHLLGWSLEFHNGTAVLLSLSSVNTNVIVYCKNTNSITLRPVQMQMFLGRVML